MQTRSEQPSARASLSRRAVRGIKAERLRVLVLVVYFYEPLQDSSSVRQQGGLPGPPPVVPDPESIDTQAITVAVSRVPPRSSNYYS